MLKLVLESGESVDLDSISSLTVGRDASMCNFPIEDNSLSRKHAEITHAQNNKLCICDLGSTNGTYLNGAALKLQTLYELRPGDELSFGGVTASIVDSNNLSPTVQETHSESFPQKVKKARPQKSNSNEPGQLEYLGFFPRLITSIIDYVVLTIANFILVLPFMSDKALAGIINIAYALVAYWLYYTLMESSHYQATLGKLALKCKVTDLDGERIGFGQANARYWAKMVSCISLMGGYLMPFFNSKKQTLHDKIAKCVVIKVN